MNKKINLRFIGILYTIASLNSLSFQARCQQPVAASYLNLISSGELKIDEIRVNSERIGLYEKFEVTFNLEGTWDNPFDPDQVKVDGHFHSPDGKLLVVPGFFYQEYLPGSGRRLEKGGAPLWKVRFAPVQEGEYKYEIVANNRGREVTSQTGSFTSISYKINHGFLRISKTNPLYFEYDDGTPFFAVAVDNATNNNYNYERQYFRFSRAGGNYNRLFIQSGSLDLGEIKPASAGPDQGLGKINLDAAWRLDKVIELGENYGIYHQMCLTNQYNFNVLWKTNVFNKENGGILESAKEYFTSEEAMKYLEKRFRYIVARWGYSQAVFSWNLWNEYSAQPGFEPASAAAWHQRMAKYVSSIDPFKHVIHTNDGRLNGVDEVSRLPEIEMISTNSYGIKNIADVSQVWTRKFTETYKKPYMLAEFGIGHNNLPKGGYAGVDPGRVMIHDALWSPLMNGSAGTGMAWEGNWIDDKQVYSYLAAVSEIVQEVPFSKRQWKPVSVSSFKFKKPQPQYFGDAIIEGWNPTGNYGMPAEASVQKLFTIDKNGKVTPNEYLSAVLVDTTGRKNSRSIPSVSFKAEYPVDGEFVIYTSDMRPTQPVIKMNVSVDGKQMLQKDIPGLPFMQSYSVSVPKGPHTITIANGGGGTFQTSFELKNFIQKNGPDLEVRGMQTDDYILLWLKNQKFTLLHEMNNIGVASQPEGILELDNIPDGTWMAKWVNTIDASTIRTELVKSKGGKVILQTPFVDKSIAVRLHKL